MELYSNGLGVLSFLVRLDQLYLRIMMRGLVLDKISSHNNKNLGTTVEVLRLYYGSSEKTLNNAQYQR